MIKGFIILIVMLGVMTSCMKEQVLTLNELQEKPSYFIECYLMPNDIYRLSATKIQPINEDYILDYSLEFNVRIDTLSLIQGLYKEEGTKYVFNYGHWYRFNSRGKEVVTLQVITPENDTIHGSTTIPEELSIRRAGIDNNLLFAEFNASNRPDHNYYIEKIQYHYADTVNTHIHYLNYSSCLPDQSIRLENTIPNDQDYDCISIHIMRLTQENYNYQLSLDNAKDSNHDNLIQPAPLQGNLVNSLGIFTCYTEDSILLQAPI